MASLTVVLGIVVVVVVVGVAVVAGVALRAGGGKAGATADMSAPEAASEPDAGPGGPEVGPPTDTGEIQALLSDSSNPVVRVNTAKGGMLVELFEDKTPNTVANMISLAEAGFYRGMAFHRIIPDFMAQGGCPHSKEEGRGAPGTGGPGYAFGDEIHPALKHTGRGILSMANAGPNTNGSQFFLCFTDTAFLDGKHAVFGKVVAGHEVLDTLEAVGSPSGSPAESIRFDIEVVLKRDHAYEVEKVG